MKIKTFLPLFSGFYNTLLDPDEKIYDYQHENNLNDNHFDFDYKTYEYDVVNEICDFVASNCELINSVELERVNNPKEYNFANDSADVIIDVDNSKLISFIYANESGLNDYFKEHYTIRSGFIPSYPDNFKEWESETNNFTELDGHYLGAILDYFFREYKEIDDFTVYEIIEAHPECYVNLLVTDVYDLHKFEKISLAKNQINELDIFGYTEILINQAKERAEMFLTDWQTEFAEREYNYILEQTGKEKVFHSEIE